MSMPMKDSCVKPLNEHEIKRDYANRYSTISAVNIKNEYLCNEERVLNEDISPIIVRHRRNSIKKMSPFDNNLYERKPCYLESVCNELEIIEENDNQNRHSFQSSNTSEYEISERSSDTGVESLSLNSKVASSISALNEDNDYMIENKLANARILTSSNSSFNSEEGYYSNHDLSSMSTLVDENQLQNKSNENKQNALKRTLSNPELNKKTTFEIIKLKEKNKLTSKAEMVFQSVDANCMESPEMNFKQLNTISNDVNSVTETKQNSNNLLLLAHDLKINESKNIKTNVITSQLSCPLNSTIDDETSSQIFNYAITNQRRSVSSYKINISKNLDKNKLMQLKSNFINPNNNNNKHDENTENNNLNKNDFLLRDAFGLKFLMQAESLFVDTVRELIKKFESHRQQSQYVSMESLYRK